MDDNDEWDRRCEAMVQQLLDESSEPATTTTTTTTAAAAAAAAAAAVFHDPIVVPRGPKWCHFGTKCKYLLAEKYHVHFKSFVHLCLQDDACVFLHEHLNGTPMTQAAQEHFQRWKHTCPQGSACVHLHTPNSNAYKEHVLVYTHKTKR